MIGHLTLATLFTICGLIAAVGAIFAGLRRDFPLAMQLLALSGICDLIDGPIARKFNRGETDAKFGKEIDSLVDMAAFGMAPIAILGSMADSAISMVLISLYPVAVAMRLAYFNIIGLSSSHSGTYYTGLPCTYVALVLPIVFLVTQHLAPANLSGIMVTTLCVLSVAYVIRIPVRKPRGLAFPFLFGICLIVLVMLEALPNKGE